MSGSLVLSSCPNRANARPAPRHPVGLNEKKSKNEGIVSGGWSDGSGGDDLCVIADYTAFSFFSFFLSFLPEIVGCARRQAAP